SILSVLIALVLIKGAGLGYQARIWGLLLASLTIAAPTFSHILSKNEHLYSRKMWQRIGRRTLPLLPHALSGALSVQIDRFIISATLGTAALAKYSVAHSLAAALTMLTGAAGSALSPWIIRKLKSGKAETVSDICSHLLILLSCATVAVVAISPEAMRILAPSDYADATVAVLPIALSAIPSLVYSLGSVVLIHKKRGGLVSVSALISSLSAISFGFLLIPRLNYLGAGLAHLASQSLGAIFILVFLKKRTEGIFSSSSIITALALALSLSFAAVALTDRPVIRMLLLLFVIGFAMLRLAGARTLISEK
ncbi:MAG: oligosaccharide flippase family protein, partial [Clostridia bacterium]|nr:oligosaccharide flippase family protein [Clostridia bacterium]